MSRESPARSEKTVQVRLEIGPELLLAGSGAQITQAERRGIVEGLAGGLPERHVLVRDAGLVEPGLHIDDRLLCWLQHRIQPTKNHHRQDHVSILAPDVQIAKHIVGDAPDKVRNPIQIAVAHPPAPVLVNSQACHACVSVRHLGRRHVADSPNSV